MILYSLNTSQILTRNFLLTMLFSELEMTVNTIIIPINKSIYMSPAVEMG